MSKNKQDMVSWTSIYLKIKDEIFNMKFNVEMFFLDFYYVNIYSYFFKTWTPSVIFIRSGSFKENEMYYNEQLTIKFEQKKKRMIEELITQLKNRHRDKVFDDFYYTNHRVYVFRNEKQFTK